MALVLAQSFDSNTRHNGNTSSVYLIDKLTAVRLWVSRFFFTIRKEIIINIIIAYVCRVDVIKAKDMRICQNSFSLQILECDMCTRFATGAIGLVSQFETFFFLFIYKS